MPGSQRVASRQQIRQVAVERAAAPATRPNVRPGAWPGAPQGVAVPADAANVKEAIEMVVIRLARGGAKKRPFYNIVVADSRERRDGRFIERVGFYNPMAAGGEQPLRVAMDRVGYWSGVGARLSPTVSRLVDQAKQAA
jgi:small subunit ribosomal protein S16